MSKTEILEKAIWKAIRNGWDFLGLTGQMTWDFSVKEPFFNGNPIVTCTPDFAGPYKVSINDIVFNHRFAKAFFGIDPLIWHAALQNMVISDDPIRYLEKFL